MNLKSEAKNLWKVAETEICAGVIIGAATAVLAYLALAVPLPGIENIYCAAAAVLATYPTYCCARETIRKKRELTKFLPAPEGTSA